MTVPMTGVRQIKHNRWYAQHYYAGSCYYLGTFDTVEEANAARQASERIFKLLRTPIGERRKLPNYEILQPINASHGT